MELTALDIRHFELHFRYGISKTDLAGGYDAVKAQVEKDFPGHTFEEMLGEANRAFEKRKADAKPAKAKDNTMAAKELKKKLTGANRVVIAKKNKRGEYIFYPQVIDVMQVDIPILGGDCTAIVYED